MPKRGKSASPEEGRAGRLERLSLSQCRELIGPGCRLSDTELLDLRARLYEFADLTLEAVPKRRQGPAR